MYTSGGCQGNASPNKPDPRRLLTYSPVHHHSTQGNTQSSTRLDCRAPSGGYKEERRLGEEVALPLTLEGKP